MPLRVLFLRTGNSAPSILFAATLNHVGDGRFQAYSAGSQPAGHFDPHARVVNASEPWLLAAQAREPSVSSHS